jgi:hypothetical protein
MALFSNYHPISLDTAYPVIKETVPASRLGYSTNNIYPDYAPLMHDGRSILASFQPQAEWNNQVLKESGIQTNWEYRQFLSKNARKIMEQNFRLASNDIGYFQRYSQETVPSATQNYRQPPSDLRQLYLTREQLDARIHP